MVGHTPPPDESKKFHDSGYSMSLPEMSKNYRPQFRINVDQWRKLWERLKFDQPLTDLEVHQMTDQFVNFVWSGMNQVLQDALKKQKKRDQEEKKERDSG